LATIIHALVFGATIFVALSLLRLVTPQLYDKIGLPRLAFLSVDLRGYARYTAIPTILFGAAIVATGTAFPYWLTVAFGLGFALANVVLFRLAQATCRSTANHSVARTVVTLIFVGLSVLLLLGCIAIPFVVQLLGYSA
jgi:hypothetical protein